MTRLRIPLLVLLLLLLAPGASRADTPAPGVPICSATANLLNGLGAGYGLAGSNDRGTIGFSQPTYTANEAAGQFWVTITRTVAAGSEIIYYGVRQYSAQSPWDFHEVPNTEAIMVPGQSSCQFPVTIADNGMNGPSIQATAYLYGSSRAVLAASPGNEATITILRNDPLATRDPANPLEISPAPTDGDPLTGAHFYVMPRAQSAAGLSANAALTHGDGLDAQALNFIADQPTGYRFWYWNRPDPASEVSRFLETAEYDQPNTVVELSTYSLVHDHCGSTATPAFTARYLNWIRGLAQGIGNFHVVLFFELDSLITTPCLNSAQLHERLVDQLRPAIQILEADPHLAVYVDGGASDALPWQLTARDLRLAGVQNAQGFFLNSTHFQWDTTEIDYGQKISRRLGGAHFLISSGVNGRGPLLNPHPRYQGIEDLCNPPGRGLGTMSTQTGYTGLDGLLWFAPVGNSGGPCRPGAPPTAVYWPAYAVSLYEHRAFGITGPTTYHLRRSGSYVPYDPSFVL